MWTTGTGHMLGARNVQRDFAAAIKAAGVPALTFHGLRHTWASLAIAEAKIPLPIVSARLGHHSVAFTLATYAHALPGQDSEAALELGVTAGLTADEDQNGTHEREVVS